MAMPRFYSGTKNASSWAMRAWLALKAAGVAFDEIVIDIRRPQRFANLAAVGRFAPSATVPVLVVDEQAIFDSLAIMEYANDASGGRLLPTDMLDRAAARALVAWQHAGLSRIAGRISFESAFYPDKRALAATEVQECDRVFAHLERLLARSGGPFVFGACSLVEFALAPAVVRLDRHRLDWSRWSRVERWAAQLLALPHVREWLAEADALPPVWYDDYLLAPEAVPSAATAWKTTVLQGQVSDAMPA